MASSAAAAAAIAAAKAVSGVIVILEPEEFLRLLGHVKEPLIVIASGGFFSTKYQYLVSYKGLAFFTKSNVELALPPDAQLVTARKLWIPGA